MASHWSGGELPTPLQHRHATSVDLARGEWISLPCNIATLQDTNMYFANNNFSGTYAMASR
jgi:hypothetical protein